MKPGFRHPHDTLLLILIYIQLLQMHRQPIKSWLSAMASSMVQQRAVYTIPYTKKYPNAFRTCTTLDHADTRRIKYAPRLSNMHQVQSTPQSAPLLSYSRVLFAIEPTLNWSVGSLNYSNAGKF